MVLGLALAAAVSAPALAGEGAKPLSSGKSTTPPREILKTIRDNEPRSNEQFAAFLQVIHNLTSEEIHSLVDPDVNWESFRDRPQEIRGRYGRVVGDLVSAVPEPYIGEPRGLKQYWTCWIRGRTEGDAHDRLCQVIVLEQPPVVSPLSKPGDSEDSQGLIPFNRRPHVSFEGIYFYNFLVIAEDPMPGRRPERSYPMLVGREVRPIERVTRSPPTSLVVMLIAFSVGFTMLVGVVFALRMIRASRRRDADKTILQQRVEARKKGKPLAPPPGLSAIPPPSSAAPAVPPPPAPPPAPPSPPPSA